MTDEEELQALLDQYVEPESKVWYIPGDKTGGIPEMWMWDVRHENLSHTVRVQERRRINGEIEQRCKNRYDDGESSDWTMWYSALESWAVKRES